MRAKIQLLSGLAGTRDLQFEYWKIQRGIIGIKFK